MSDPRKELERYADEHEGTERLTHIHRADAAPRAFDALRAVLELHRPRLVQAYDYDQRRHVTVQQCVECADQCHSRSGLGCDSPDAPWPCATVRAVTHALTGGTHE